MAVYYLLDSFEFIKHGKAFKGQTKSISFFIILFAIRNRLKKATIWFVFSVLTLSYLVFFWNPSWITAMILPFLYLVFLLKTWYEEFQLRKRV